MDPVTTLIVTTVVKEVVNRALKAISTNSREESLARPVPIALRCHGGQFLCADQNKGGQVVADRNECRDWEVFLLRHLGGGKVNLLACDGRYVCADRNRGGILVADRKSAWSLSPWSWELFVLEYWGGRIALRSSFDLYVCAENGGGGTVVADRKQADAWELFEFVQLQPLMDGRAV